MEAIYLHDWAPDPRWPDGTGPKAVQTDFGVSDAAFDGVEILLASYSYQDYSGDAYVLFRKNGELFEVTGGHCSCYGLEDQWEPEPVTLDDLKNEQDHWRRSEHKDALKLIISQLESE